MGCSLLEAQSGESEEAETVTAMALLSVGAERGGTEPNPRYGLGEWIWGGGGGEKGGFGWGFALGGGVPPPPPPPTSTLCRSVEEPMEAEPAL